MPPDSTPILVWFRHDLRLSDHAPLTAAAQTGRPVIPLFIQSDDDEGEWPLGSGSRVWLRSSIESLDRDLQKKGSRLILRAGSALREIPRLADSIGGTAVYWSERVEPQARTLSDQLAETLKARGIERHIFPDTWLHPPGEIVTGQGTPYRVFTPYSRAAFAAEEPPAPLPVPRKWNSPSKWPESVPLNKLLPSRKDEPAIPGTLRPGSGSAMSRLKSFLDDGIEAYPTARDRIDADGTSSLAPHLHFGEISAREAWHRVRSSVDGRSSPKRRKGSEAFLRQLLWREFARLTLIEHPDMGGKPVQASFNSFPWRTNKKGLQAWKDGRTGYPIVDAAMRQLAETGCMHNRLRMIVASFLCKHLLISWTEGEAWFWEKLLDADLANNAFGWQWVAGCGLDAAPYIRVFNPTLQGQRFDPKGNYVTRWLPLLEPLGPKALHEPVSASPMDLEMAGIRLGENYPEPIVNHREARQRALMAFEGL